MRNLRAGIRWQSSIQRRQDISWDAFLNRLSEFHKKSQDGEIVEELSILGFYHFTAVSLYKNDK